MKAIADTGFIVAFGSRGDSHHAWAVDIAKNITEPLLTCEAVLAEAAFHLGSSSYVLSLLQNDMFRLGFDLTRNLEQLAELAKRYDDRRPDLADLCIIRQQLESAKGEKGNQRFLRLAGKINGPPDLSSRKGFSRK